MTAQPPNKATTYVNPVFAETFADPFVLKHRGEYWAYCTGLQADGGAFGVLRSQDLINWETVGSAMAPLPGAHPCYWAPEVSYDNGRFYLYYSVGNEETMHIRVAVAVKPAGPFVDSGRRLTGEPFAIDPHVFHDDDGRRFLFYATDFYEHTHIGTGTVRDRLLDPFTLAGQPQVVSRPRYDWQVYDAQREEKGGVRWHTVEGPFVLKRKGKYYQMFSGGNWQNPSYGVGYALTDDLDTPDEWTQVCDGEQVLPILRTVPGAVKGPGHNSVVRGPDNVQRFCIYHRWNNGEGRQMAIDALDWAGERLLVLGPSHTPLQAPLQPHLADFFPGQTQDRPARVWRARGSEWVVRDGAAIPDAATAPAELAQPLTHVAFVTEVSMAGLASATGGAWGVNLSAEGRPLLSFRLLPGADAAAVEWYSGQGRQERQFALPEDFDFAAYHLLRMEVDGVRVRLALDDGLLAWQGEIVETAQDLALQCDRARAAFSGFALTYGWQASFMTVGSARSCGWYRAGEQWQIANGQLTYHGEGASRIFRGPRFEDYELVVNTRLLAVARQTACYGFLPALNLEGKGPLVTVEREENGWRLLCEDGDVTTSFTLPPAFEATDFHQFRFRKEKGRVAISCEGRVVGAIEVDATPAQVGLYGRAAAVAFDQVRVTALRGDSFEGT